MLERIEDDDDLRRHLNPEYLHEDGTVSIRAYNTSEMSLDLCRMRSLAISIASHPGWGMSEFAARVPRGCGLDVVHDPIKDDPRDPDNDAHCVIHGKTSKGQAKTIRDAARLVHRPA